MDVVWFDGIWDCEFEMKKVGVRVVVFMLVIEIVVFGGGSICGFDGVKLYVGLVSAGVEFGLVCYGCGGLLIVIDLNLYLGCIVLLWFLFLFDFGVVKCRLDVFCEQIVDLLFGCCYELCELVEGFFEIVNVNMVRVIRCISMVKGYDLVDYVFVIFGGVGVQYVGAIVSELGIETVLVYLYVGILSVWGIGLVDVWWFCEQLVLCLWVQDVLESVELLFL